MNTHELGLATTVPPVWKPTPDQIAKANLTAFVRFVRGRWQPGLEDYSALYRWSVEKSDEFWHALWEFCGVVASQRWDRVVDDFHLLPGAHWFPGARLNFAENLLRYRDGRRALVFWNENGFQRSLTYAELYDEVARLAQSLRDLGVTAGDRIAGFIPNMPEAVIAMLATASLGAIWSSCSPDFGTQGVVDRFSQIDQAAGRAWEQRADLLLVACVVEHDEQLVVGGQRTVQRLLRILVRRQRLARSEQRAQEAAERVGGGHRRGGAETTQVHVELTIGEPVGDLVGPAQRQRGLSYSPHAADRGDGDRAAAVQE